MKDSSSSSGDIDLMGLDRMDMGCERAEWRMNPRFWLK